MLPKRTPLDRAFNVVASSGTADFAPVRTSDAETATVSMTALPITLRRAIALRDARAP